MIPASTYRLQVTAEQNLDVVRTLVPYLHRLGIEALYLSPLFHARSGSTHGYDAVDPTRISEELGGRPALDRLAEVLHEHRMGLLLDIVPNHLAATPENPWWRDVLEHGPASPWARHFDIEWERPEAPATGKIVLPILGERYGECLARGRLTVALTPEGFGIRYFETLLPLDPRGYPRIFSDEIEAGREQAVALARGEPADTDRPGEGWRGARGDRETVAAALAGSGDGGAIEEDAGSGSFEAKAADGGELDRLLQSFGKLPPRDDPDPAAREHRIRESRRLRDALATLLAEDESARAAVDEALARLNGEAATAGTDRRTSRRRLDAILADQAWWLAFWRTEAEATNYRRFFNISGLVGVRVEDPDVFRDTHEAVLGLVRDGVVTGLRIDHIDGLHDPAGYLERLRRLSEQAAPGPGPFQIVVEKILAEDEVLPRAWPVSGSTGYDFLAALNGLFVDPAGLAFIERHYRETTDFHGSFAELLYRKKRTTARELFAGDLRVLARQAAALVRSTSRGRDFTHREVGDALLEITASLPVYRTYVGTGPPGEEDVRRLRSAVSAARQRAPAVPDVLLDLLAGILAVRDDEADREGARAFVRRWQQLTGAIMAKGMEDTTFYIYNALVSLNEVGGEPGGGATAIERFHDFNRLRLRRWPGGLNTTSTHDTKRSEDVRTRISVLSELPAPWEGKVRQWREWNRDRRTRSAAGRAVPSPNEELMLYQNLLGAWPLHADEEEGFRSRLDAYLTKALREAKVHSSWRSPDTEYEGALVDFAERILDPGRESPFLEDFRRFQGEIAFYGALNSLSQLVLKLVSPGVPDIYQGSELWNLSLVDPDNRRPVDFAARVRMLDELDAGHTVFPHRLLDAWEDGRIKLLLTHRALRFRRRHRELFLRGDYLALRSEGAHRDRVMAAARKRGGDWVLGVAPRWYTRLAPPDTVPLGPEVWRDTILKLPDGAPREWTDVLSGRRASAEGAAGGLQIRLADVLTHLPVAMLAAVG